MTCFHQNKLAEGLVKLCSAISLLDENVQEIKASLKALESKNPPPPQSNPSKGF
jgi:hypothetical protein